MFCTVNGTIARVTLRNLSHQAGAVLVQHNIGASSQIFVPILRNARTGDLRKEMGGGGDTHVQRRCYANDASVAATPPYMGT